MYVFIVLPAFRLRRDLVYIIFLPSFIHYSHLAYFLLSLSNLIYLSSTSTLSFLPYATSFASLLPPSLLFFLFSSLLPAISSSRLGFLLVSSCFLFSCHFFYPFLFLSFIHPCSPFTLTSFHSVKVPRCLSPLSLFISLVFHLTSFIVPTPLFGCLPASFRLCLLYSILCLYLTDSASVVFFKSSSCYSLA